MTYEHLLWIIYIYILYVCMDIQAGKVTSSPWHGGDGEKSHQVKESHIREEESPWHSSIIGDF